MARNRYTKMMERIKEEIKFFESSRDYHSYDELSTRFAVSKSTIYQDISFMKAFFDIEFERQGKNGKGIRFVDSYYRKTTFTYSQQKVLIKYIRLAKTESDAAELITILKLGADMEDNVVKDIIK